MFRALQIALVPALVLATWHALSALEIINPQILPSPLAVLRRWLEYAQPTQAYDAAQTGYLAWLASGELWHDTWASLTRVVGGFAIGAGLALPLALVMGANATVYGFLNPLVQVLRPIPPIAYIPLAIL